MHHDVTMTDAKTLSQKNRSPKWPWATAILCLTALALAAHNVEGRTNTPPPDKARLALEKAMLAEETRLVRELFSLSPKRQRSFQVTATAYCPLCGLDDDDEPQDKALGGPVRPGRTVAVSRDLKHLLGRRVYIKGLGVRVVEDLMHPRFSKRLDLCLSNRNQAVAFGVKRLEMVVLD